MLRAQEQVNTSPTHNNHYMIRLSQVQSIAKYASIYITTIIRLNNAIYKYIVSFWHKACDSSNTKIQTL